MRAGLRPAVFWVASENRDFLTAELKPNATYIVEIRPTMGAVKAAVRIYPVSPENTKVLKRVSKLLAKNEPTELKGQEEDMAYFIKTGMERFEKIKADAKSLNPEWTF